MNKLPFKPADLRSISDMCASREIPQSLRTVRELCRRKKFPATKVGRDWKTTPALVRAHYFKKGNASFKASTN